MRDQTAFRFALAAPADVTLEVYDRIGRRVATLLDETRGGDVVVPWSPEDLDAGVYLVRLRADGAVATQVVTVIR